MHPFAYQKLTSSSSSLVVSTTKQFWDHDKENVIVHQPPPTQHRHISSAYHTSVDMSLTMEDQEASRLKQAQNLSTHENTMHLVTDLNRFNNNGVRPLIQEEDDMDLTGELMFVHVPKTAEPMRSPRKTVLFHQPLNLSVSIEDSVQIYDTKSAPPVSERVVFRSNPIASKFPASFTRRLNHFADNDMSFGLYFALDKPVTVSPLDDTNAMNMSTMARDSQKSTIKAPTNRRTIHFEQHNEIDVTLLSEELKLEQSKICKNTSIQYFEENMSIGQYLAPVVAPALENTNLLNVSLLDGDLQKSTVERQQNRNTIHFDSNKQLEETALPQTGIKTEIIEMNTVRKTRSKVRETVYLDEDIDTATAVVPVQLSEPRVERTKGSSKTMNLFQDIEKSTENSIEPVQPPQQKRQTFYCNETIADTSLVVPVREEVGHITNSTNELNLVMFITHDEGDNAKVTEIRSEAEMNLSKLIY
jgi:hypothetical protein